MTIRPLLFWGLDLHAAGFARDFVGHLKRTVPEMDGFRTFEPTGNNPLEEFEKHILELREDLSSTHNLTHEPGVVLLSAAFASGAQGNLALLKGIGEILDRALPGDQAITLGVLFPPQTAERQDKLETFKFFLRLEEIAWDVSHLKTVFVNQFYSDLYEKYSSNEDSSGNETSEQINLNAFVELLHRELIDPDLQDSIKGIGQMAIGNQNLVLGRKCCYATTGVYKLIYLQKECLKYLKARFQKEIFNNELYNLDFILKNKKKLKAIQDRADQFIQTQVKKFLSVIPAPEPVALSATDQWVDMETLYKVVSELEKDVSSVTLRVRTKCEKELISIKEIVEQEFINFMGEGIGYFAGPKMYADALMGTRFFSDSEEKAELPSGIEMFEKMVCIDAFVDSWTKFFQPHLETAFSRLELLLAEKQDTDSTFSWLVRSMELTSSRIRKIDAGKDSDLYFLFQIIDATLSHLRKRVFDVDSGTSLTHEIMLKFRQGFHELDSIIQENRKRREEAEEEGRRLRKEYGLLKRFISKSVRNEFNRREGQGKKLIKTLDIDYELYVQASQNMRAFLIDVVNCVVVSNNVRSLFCQTFNEAVQKICQTYYGFVGQIESSIQDQWVLGSQVTQYTKRTATTILNNVRLDLLYEVFLQGKKLYELAEELFLFFPSDLTKSEMEELSYYGCKDPKDHYREGTDSLIHRMADCSDELCTPVKKMSIMDVISIEGREKAHEYLKENLENTKKFLDFSQGLLPLVEQHRMMNSLLVIKSADSVNNRLASDHGSIFGSDAHFVDNSDPEIIDITRLVFGFPAFLIHGLSECRDIFHKSENIASRDLWPQSTV